MSSQESLRERSLSTQLMREENTRRRRRRGKGSQVGGKGEGKWGRRSLRGGRGEEKEGKRRSPEGKI